ncbi:mating-type protein MAT alpha 1-domain-containing protein [Chaetomidium leptoderma]|uniref:Mating-type protein MAT alpha 1-domain-containing protein n=1 Tax=Chaetomidium leptoderma TaxID=669021 RepID=A0AAN6VR55_9PEZI|nr:mating-type protein MAT alpha 1-domain-containing protein [Chaetomidium leptoderma]
MSGINQILQTFERLGEGDRETTMQALSTMMRVENQRQPAKKKVNGFMGYRAYYSSLFSQLTQKEKSPIMTLLWKQDPFHKEWDFMCAVYSAIREFLSDENVSLQDWIQFAIKPMGIVVRESYLTALGWELMTLDDGTHKIERIATREVQSYLQPTNGLGLFMNCLNDGLPVGNPLPIIAKLSDLANDVICVNTQLSAEAKPANTMEGFRQFAKSHPQMAMSAFFQVPAAHPLITQGVSVHQVDNMSGLPATEPFFMPNEDPELDAMLDNILNGQGDGDLNKQANLGNQFYSMGMGNGTPGFN